MLYRGMERAALDAAYNNTAAVGQTKRAAYVADWTRRSDAIRTRRALGSIFATATAPVTGSTSSPAARRMRRRSPTSTAATGR